MPNEKYLDIDESFNFIDRCFASKQAILGFDGFKKEGKFVIPQMDCIADFSSILKEESWNKIVEISYRSSKKILLELKNKKDFVYDFVTMNEDEWKNKSSNK